MKQLPHLFAMLCLLTSVSASLAAAERVVRVADDAALRQVLRAAQPGTRIVIAPGKYRPEVYAANLKGTAEAPIIIEGADAKDKPLFQGGRQGLHFSDCTHLTLRNIAISGQSINGINIDDGGSFNTPSHHITLESVDVFDVGPSGNHDPIKLSGIDDLTIRGCRIEGWGGQAIDMVGCHRGLIENCTFQGKQGFSQDAGPQTKGGSSDITIRNCTFINAAGRGVNAGGSTSLTVFRPKGAKYEAKNITVEGCRFVGCQAPIAFVGVDGAVFRYNTIYHPDKWIIRILQETREPGFVACRNGRFERNLVVFRSRQVQIHVNIGTATDPASFSFRENFWFCEDQPARSRPGLPAREENGVYGVDPKLAMSIDGVPGVPSAESAKAYGADALPTKAASSIPQQPWFPKAPPLPQPTGQVIRVASVDELFRAAEQVRPGGTILVADGHYMLPRTFDLHTHDITLRGESGERNRVILDGAQSRHGELVGITGCSGVTIADLTIQNIRANGFKINSDRFTTQVTIHNCVIHNIWERGVKGPAVRAQDRERFRPSDCRIQYCLFYNDRPKQFSDDPADTAQNFGGNYVGGIDAMYPRRWTISDNVFIGIQGRTRSARGAVFLWQHAEDCIIERNIIIDCDSGICLGNSFKPDDVRVHATGCIVRNNFITRCPEQGILADYTRDCRILHNTIHDPASRLQRLTRLVHDNEGLVVANNLLSGPAMRIETESRFENTGNVTRDMTNELVDPRGGNLHLKRPVPQVVDAARPAAGVATDIDNQQRDDRPDVGADEHRP